MNEVTQVIDKVVGSSVLKTYEPMTIEDALAVNIPDLVLKDWQDKVDLARDLARDLIPGMTEFQIKQFVAGDQTDNVTPYGIYQQALRELGTRYQSILEARYEYEKSQAELKQIQASLERIEAEYEKTKSSTDREDWMETQHEASVMKEEAEKDRLLRQMPLIEVRLRDILRQLVHYVDVWQTAKDDIDFTLSDHEMQRIEWEAKIVMRYFKGKLGYIPTQFDNIFLNDCLELAMDMREYGFTNEMASEVVCCINMEVRQQKFKEMVLHKQLEPANAVLPLNNQDELCGFIAQRRAARVQMKRG